MGFWRRPVIGFVAVALALTLLPAPALPLRAAAPESPSQLDLDTQGVLQELFTLGRSLEEIRTRMADMDTKIQATLGQQADAGAELDRLAVRRHERQAMLGRRMRFYHEQGRAAPLGVLMGATSFDDFLTRADLISRIMDYDAELLNEVRSLTEETARQERAYRDSAALLVTFRQALTADEAKLQAEIARRETILADLQERRAAVEAELNSLEHIWKEKARPVLEALGAALQHLNPDKFEPDSVSMSLFPPGATVLISAENLGRFIAGTDALKGLTFRIEPGKVSLEGEFEGTPVRVAGTFSIGEKGALRFVPLEVRIRDFTVPATALATMPGGGAVDIDVSELVKPFALKEVTVLAGQIRFRAAMR